MSAGNMKIRATVGMSYACRSYRTEEVDLGVTPEEWAEMDEKDRNELVDETYETWKMQWLDGGCEVIEP